MARYFYLGGINEHLFFDTSNSISRLVSGGLLPNNPALALLWLLIPISGLSHGVIATVLRVFIRFTFHHLFIGASDKRSAAAAQENPTGREGAASDNVYAVYILANANSVIS